jgi:hypothetical protein
MSVPMKGFSRVADRAVARNSLHERQPPGLGDRHPFTSMSSRPACTVRRSAVASPLLTKSCNIPIAKPCVRRMDSVLPFGLPASIRNASRWSKGIAILTRIARLPSPPGSAAHGGYPTHRAPSARNGALRGVTMPAKPREPQARASFPIPRRQGGARRAARGRVRHGPNDSTSNRSAGARRAPLCAARADGAREVGAHYNNIADPA